MHPTGWEISIFIILTAASVLISLRKLLPVIRTIERSKRDPGWRFGGVRSRIRAFVWEVMLQEKVIKQRPLPGLAHAFVFWGFCAFALITLDHFAH
ncbi:MAG TPA: [Fe-S]-binding protein, partial [Bryobacteraceae bacterium]|nr:[Fe-S]-binding protein [Bryobacteraceae bacterium]